MGEPAGAQMDTKNRALCFALRFPIEGKPRMTLKHIVKKKMVRKTDGTVPSEAAISKAAKSFNEGNEDGRGRPTGSRNTTAAEDRVIMKTFKKLRPPGAYVDARIIHTNLPKKIKDKITQKTVLNRLAEKGYTMQPKLDKTDLGPTQTAKRYDFSRKLKDLTAAQWKVKLQACGDIKEFTYYPKGLRSKFKRLRASRTIMSAAERRLPAFQRPKKWFTKAEWKHTQKQKLFGLTTSTGKICAFLIPSTWNADVWAGLVRTQLGPFMRRSFPNRSNRVILLDGEKVLRAPAAMSAYREFNISLLLGWPANSPELNPQENVWPLAEAHLRNDLEDDSTDTFEDFQANIVYAVQNYISPEKLIPSMAARINECFDGKGAMIRR